MPDNPRIEELRRRVQADPASIAFAALAEEFRRLGRYDEAIDTCRTGLQRHPAYLSARVTLGRALIETGEFDAAREELETVLRSAPENLAAIRGLAQIHEKLGQSTEMDPHLADMMKTMHAESIRVATVAPPPSPPPVAAPPAEVPIKMRVAAPEPPVARAPDPPVEAAPVTMAPTPEPMTPAPTPVTMASAAEPGTLPPAAAPPADTGSDLFAGFAPMAKREAAPDFSFDLVPTAKTKPPAADAPSGNAFEMATEVPASPFDIEPMPSFDLAATGAIETLDTSESIALPIERPAAAFERMELAIEPVEEIAAPGGNGPDPAVLATLARLERFLGAVRSLRA